jgi:hypothetical protein
LPPLVARECRLYLSAATGWPYRLEWWGAVSPNGPEGLLLQMEFRNPRFYAELPRPLAGEFTFNPAGAKVPDKTDEMLDMLRAHMKQLQQPRGP